MKPISELRTEYTKATLDQATVDKNPIAQFEKWFHEALEAEVLEANAMTLSTVTESGRPTARIVLLKGIEQNKFLFYTNYQSQKGKELDNNPACALTFFWPELERQVRIEGISERLESSVSEAYFQSRPRSSQIGAWASPQSTIIKDRSLLEVRAREIEKRFAGNEILPKPNQWGGYAIEPFEIEFWQGRPSRLHDRIVYYKSENQWVIHRLAP
ncbi:MAG TPA: pyridoxamine 5'-phosphate oxidase [Cyclobacteriaceae bacterium]|nr:pyridoxamine 5'-phosphate oxidase [Cyclobacteriaceae bacterium]